MSINGLAPLLPLVYDNEGPYKSLVRYEDLVQQNFKMLLLTSPGERMMEPDYGVGLRRFLFQQNTFDTRDLIGTKIRKQLAKYMPYVRLLKLEITDSDITGTPIDSGDGNVINVNIEYYAETLSQSFILSLTGDTSTKKIFL
jgi:phage baseplate assembly protein W